MQALQQRFWPDAQPLVERFGRDFFRAIPETAGVYLMRGISGIVLYVGKAKNLRKRLNSYRVANPDRMPRRILRLLNTVTRIDLEECQDEQAALRRESELLLAFKPRFNRAGVWRPPQRFLAWRSDSSGIQLTIKDAAEHGWQWTGPFGAKIVHLHRAVVRLLWCQLHPQRGLTGMPTGWLRGAHGNNVVIVHPDASIIEMTARRLADLLTGHIEDFRQWLLPANGLFEQTVRDGDLEFLESSL